MAGNSKKKRKPGASRVRTFATKGFIPIMFRTNANDERTLKLMPQTDFAAIREGQGDEAKYWCVTNRLNWASTLASMVKFSTDPTPAINVALEALMALNRRMEDKGRCVLTGDEMRAVGEALNLADDMQDATTRRQHRDALVKLYVAMDKKESA